MSYSFFKNEDNYIYINIYFFENDKLRKFKFAFIIHIIILFYIYYKYLNNETTVLTKHFINKDIINNNNKIIEIDNKLEETNYEKNKNFSQYSTKIKVIALYFPNIYLSEFSEMMLKESRLHDDKEESKNYYQQSALLNEYENKNMYFDKHKPNNSIEYEFIYKQIELAKSHGIYGFAFYVYIFSNKIIIDRYIYAFIENKMIKFKYLFILKFKDICYKNEKLFILLQFKKQFPNTFILKIQKFLFDKRYIKFKSKPIICLDKFKNIEKLKHLISSWRNEAKNIGFKDLFIITSLKEKKISTIGLSNIINAGFEHLPNYLLRTKLRVNFIKNYTFFAGLIYNDIGFKNNNSFYIFRGSTLSNNFKIRRHNIFGEYSPELFYIMNKMIIDKFFRNSKNSHKFIFLNSWNNYYDGSYLEPDNQFGFGSLNALSKAIFNLNFRNKTYIYSNLNNNYVKVAIQAHIFYEDLIDEIISITNNIPVKFDFYITTNNLQKRKIIKEHIETKSKANKYQIKIVKNKGRDILPLLIQMRKVFNKYKYFCHIHSKKTLQNPIYGYQWRLYLYKNLLGSKDTISEILSDFEEDGKLGFIFPETFYLAKESALKLDEQLINSMNYLISKLFGEFKIGNKLDFPAGDMFWARSKAVYQIFQINLEDDIYLEGKGNQTILFAIERIWLYIVKYNGYYYKKKCGYF